jgi:hypothetical protein
VDRKGGRVGSKTLAVVGVRIEVGWESLELLELLVVGVEVVLGLGGGGCANVAAAPVAACRVRVLAHWMARWMGKAKVGELGWSSWKSWSSSLMLAAWLRVFHSK